MKTYRIVLEFTSSEYNPNKWDWHGLIGVELDEALTIKEITEIPTPDYHQEILNNNLKLME